MSLVLDHMKREVKSLQVKGIDTILFLTYRCTSKCKTCNIWKRNADDHSELDWEGWKRVLERLRDYGIKSVELFGGDALLRKDVIYKIINFCTENGIETYFPTNSILMDMDTAKSLVDAGLGTIYFSLDGVGTENDRIRGKDGSFNLVKNAIENLVKARNGSNAPKIIICSTISSLNYNHFDSIVGFLKDYPISSVYPRCLGEFSQKNIEASAVNGIYPEPFFISSGGESHLLKENEVAFFREAVRKLKLEGKKCGLPYINFRNVDNAPDKAFSAGEFGIKRCQICTTLLTLNPNGDVIPCLFFPEYVLGNINREPVGEIWGNEKHKTFIRHQRDRRINICRNCMTRTYYPTLPESLQYYAKKILEKISLAVR